YGNDSRQPLIAIAEGTLIEPHDFALSPRRRAPRRCPVAHAERWISIANAIAERGADLPHGAPDFQTAVRLAQRHGFLHHLTPRAYVLERHRSEVDIAEHRLDLFPRAPPVLARARRLAGPFFGASVTTECLAEGARRVDRHFLGLLRRKILRC